MLIHGRFIDARQTLRGLCLAGILAACGLPAGADESSSSSNSAAPQAATPAHATPAHEPVVANPALDFSGHKRLGKASFYAQKFAGRKMADGTIMRPMPRAKLFRLEPPRRSPTSKPAKAQWLPFTTEGRISKAASSTSRLPPRRKSVSTTKMESQKSRLHRSSCRFPTAA
jgi:hypothetical protein